MKNLIISILVAISSLFGFHYQQAPGAMSTPAAVEPSPLKSSGMQILATSSATTTITQSSNPFTGWQTYSSSQYGIELKYPAGWSVKEPSSTDIANLVLSKDGYTITIQICSLQSCGAAAEQQAYDQKARLSPSVVVSLNIDNHQAWREIGPSVNGEGSDALYFNFTFLRPVMPSSNQSGFNDTSKFTPVSDWIINNGMAYTIDYEPSSSATVSEYDHSIISEMDQIVQTITFI